MREGECYHSLRIPPNAWTVVRVDGRSFSRFTESRFEKPFDPAFRDHMLAAAKALMTELNGIYGFTESDEISILLPRTWFLFHREVEKVVSVSAGIASASFTLSCGEAAHFDSRIWVGATDSDVIDYFTWRQSDAARCCLNGWIYWTLRNSGQSVEEATAALERKSWAWKNEELFKHGINFNDLPAWQKRGLGLTWENYEIEGVNPITGQKTTGTRRRLHVHEDLPFRDAYTVWLRDLVSDSKTPSP